MSRHAPPSPAIFESPQNFRHISFRAAVALGKALPKISNLLSHSEIETTAPYAHLPRDSIQDAAERIADSVAANIL